MNQTPRSGEKDLPTQAVEDSIADPNGLGPIRLTTTVVTTCVGAGIFSLAGDLAPGGTNTAAVLISWAICFVGALVMCLALAPGLLAYAVMSFARCCWLRGRSPRWSPGPRAPWPWYRSTHVRL